MLQHGAAAGSGTVGGAGGWLGSGPRVGEQQEGECDDGEPRSSLNSPQVEPLHRRVFCTVRVERGGAETPWHLAEPPCLRGMHRDVCRSGRHMHVCVCANTRAQSREWVLLRAWPRPYTPGLPFVSRGPWPAQHRAATCEPATRHCERMALLILSLDTQIPAVVWENKCAERAEYLMGPFSDHNDSGNEPALSHGCQGLLGSLRSRSSAASRSHSVPGSGMRCRGLWGERRLRGAGNG